MRKGKHWRALASLAVPCCPLCDDDDDDCLAATADRHGRELLMLRAQEAETVRRKACEAKGGGWPWAGNALLAGTPGLVGPSPIVRNTIIPRAVPPVPPFPIHILCFCSPFVALHCPCRPYNLGVPVALPTPIAPAPLLLTRRYLDRPRLACLRDKRRGRSHGRYWPWPEWYIRPASVLLWKP